MPKHVFLVLMTTSDFHSADQSIVAVYVAFAILSLLKQVNAVDANLVECTMMTMLHQNHLLREERLFQKSSRWIQYGYNRIY